MGMEEAGYLQGLSARAPASVWHSGHHSWWLPECLVPNVARWAPTSPAGRLPLVRQLRISVGSGYHGAHDWTVRHYLLDASKPPGEAWSKSLASRRRSVEPATACVDLYYGLQNQLCVASVCKQAAYRRRARGAPEDLPRQGPTGRRRALVGS